MGFGAGIRRALGASLLVVVTAAQAVLLRPVSSLAQATSLRVIDNGERVTLRGDAIVQNGLVMAPYQGLSEPLGVHTTWDPTTQTL